jgi:hypothetical protein
MTQSDDDWELIPYEEQTRAGRILYRIFGGERLGRWMKTIDRKIDPPRPRCPYRAPVLNEQCTLNEGHRGVCQTCVTHTNKQTGRTRSETQRWYGINYD